MSKIILDLCGGTGSWSRPYMEAGYDVRIITLPDYDVRTYIPQLAFHKPVTDAEFRAMTPPGFACAFYEANK